MADGTNVTEPLTSTTAQITKIDTRDVDYGGGDHREQQVVRLGSGASLDITLANLRDALIAVLNATQTVTGVVAISNPTANPETGLAKAATQTDGTQKAQITNFPATQPVSGTVTTSNPTDVSALAKEATVDRRFGVTGSPKKSVSGTIAASGTTTVLTPTTGKHARVLWVNVVPSPDNSSSNLVSVQYASTQVMYTGYVISHWEMFEGTLNEVVQIVAANSQTVSYTIHYEEF